VEEAPLLAILGRQAFTETFGHHYAPEDLAAHLAKDYDPMILASSLVSADEHWRLAEWQGQPAGFVKWGACHLPLPALTQRQMELHRLYVLQAFQGKAIGRALMEAALTHMQEAGAAEICLGVWENNHKAQAFYASYGFEKAGEYDYPVGRQIDREWILRKILAAKTLEAVA
jgi:ribosomal protein S18 acetylase RimI-like enzyme